MLCGSTEKSMFIPEAKLFISIGHFVAAAEAKGVACHPGFKIRTLIF